MKKWTSETDKLCITDEAERAGCGVAIMLLLGLALTVFSGTYFYARYPAVDFSIGNVVASFFFVGGVLFMLLALYDRTVAYESTLVFDKGEEVISFCKESGGKQYSMSYGDISQLLFVYVRPTMQSNSTSRSRRREPTYTIYLIKKDGAHFFVDAFSSREKFLEVAKLLAEHIEVNIVDGSPDDLSRRSDHTYAKKTATPPDPPSRFVETEPGDAELGIILRTPMGIAERLFLTVTLGLLAAAPSVILRLTQDGSGHTEVPVLMMIFFVLYYGVIVMAILRTLRHYRVVISAETLRVKLLFPRVLAGLFNREIAIPRGDIRAVRFNRLDDSNFGLSIALTKSEHWERFKPSVLFRLGKVGHFGVPAIQGTVEDCIGLWEITGAKKEGKGPDFNDLHVIEQAMQKTLQLVEKEI